MQLRPEHLDAARDLAKKSIVLLKNEGNILPLKKDYKKIALIGPLADSHIDRDYMSFWTFSGRQQDVVTLYQGIKSKVSASTQIIVDTVCVYKKSDKYSGDERIQRFEIVLDDAAIAKAVEKAKQAEVVVLAVGENGERNGESRSRTELNLPGNQQKLVKAIVALGKPVVLVLFNGRPLTLEWESKNVPAIVEAWQPGTQAGNAVADVLFGDYNPSGKLTMSFPINVGQIPIYYNQLPTGRIPTRDQEMWKSTYSDVSNSPLYPFGFGLSYTTFSYSEITFNKTEITNNETLEVIVDVTNTGKISGEEVVQLYIRDMVAEVSRPVKELRNYQKISLKPGETQKVVFKLSVEDLKYWNNDLKYKADAGDFKVFVGPNSRDLKEKSFVLK